MGNSKKKSNTPAAEVIQPSSPDDEKAVAALALSEAPAAPLPTKLSPQLATPAAAPPTTGEWGYEIKFDGYRILVRINDGRVKFFTRNGHDWTSKMASGIVNLAPG